jgi:hypothetical protein
MISKTIVVHNSNEIEEAERLGCIPPEEVRSWDTFWFDINDVSIAYKTNKGNINLHFPDDNFYTVPYEHSIVNALNERFK